MKMLAEHIVEDPGKLIRVSGAEDGPPIRLQALAKMNVAQLEKLAKEIGSADSHEK